MNILNIYKIFTASLCISCIFLASCSLADAQKCLKGCGKEVFGIKPESSEIKEKDPDAVMALGLLRHHIMQHEEDERRQREAKACAYLAMQGVPCNYNKL